jgi:hypothetical protein
MTSECTVLVLRAFCAAAKRAWVIAVCMCKILVTCVEQPSTAPFMNSGHLSHQPGINKGKIDCLSLYFSLYAFHSARTYDARPQLGGICHMCEKCDVNCRREMWISEAFHLANLPTIPSRFSRLRLFRNRTHTRLATQRCINAAIFLLAAYRLPRICAPIAGRRPQITDSRKF